MVTNPWVVGIGGGIFSGLLVALITKVIFSRRENREYLQRVTTANNEIIYSLRPSISEKNLPSREILDSLIASTARKYGVKRNDLYDNKQLVEDIIKDIIDSGFISSQQKIEFCEQLSVLKAHPTPDIEVKPEEERLARLEESTRARLTTFLSTAMGVMAAFTSILAIATFYTSRKTQDMPLPKISENPTVLFVLIVAVLVPVSISILFVLTSRLREIRLGRMKVSIKKEPISLQEALENASSTKKG